MVWGVIAAAAIQVYSSHRQSEAAKSGAARGLAAQQSQFDKIFASLAPYRAIGEAAAPAFQRLMGISEDGSYDPELAKTELQSRPGYQVGLAQGEESVEGGAAARSGLLSGRAGKELVRFGQDYGQNFYGAELDRLQNAINIGRNANTEANQARDKFGQIGQDYAHNIANIETRNIANIGNAVQGGIGNYNYQKNLAKFGGGGDAGSTGSTSSPLTISGGSGGGGTGVPYNRFGQYAT